MINTICSVFSRHILHFGMQKEVAIISVFIWAFTFWCCTEVPVFSLDIPARLYISEATLNGIDIGKRVSFFYRMLITSACVLPLLYFILYKAVVYFRVRTSLLKPAAVVAATGFALVVADVSGIKNTNAVLLISALLLLYATGEIVSRWGRGLRLAGSGTFIAPVAVLSFLLMSVWVFFFGDYWLVKQYPVLLFFITGVGTGAALLWLGNNTGVSIRSLLNLMLPLALTPVLIFLSVELLFYFKIQNGILLRYKLLLGGLYIFSGIGWGIYWLKKRSNYSVRQLLSLFYGPAALCTFLLFATYCPVVYQSTELFEVANHVNSVMRIFHVHEIPFVDFMSSHMLNDFFFEMIYSFLFGYNGSLDFFVYHPFYYFVFSLLLYRFLLLLFRNPLAPLLFIFTFPFLDLLFVVFATYALLLFFAVQRLLRRQDMTGYLLVAGTILLLILWRLDTGAAALFTAAVYIPVCFVTGREKINFRVLMRAVALCLLALLLLCGLVVLFRTPEYVWSHFRSAIHYIAANQAHGFAAISDTFSQQFYFYYLFVPVISLLVIFRIIYLLWSRADMPGTAGYFILHAALFLYLFCMANFQRGLVRHGFIEKTELPLVSSFFIATTLFIVYYFRKQPHHRFYITFYATAFVVIFTLKYFPIPKEESRLETWLARPTLADIPSYLKDTMLQGRTVVDKQFVAQNHAAFKSFLDHHLQPGQTFLDFSNTPMLYHACQRRVPSYFCQSLQNTVDDYLQVQHLRKVDPVQVPVVVYSNYPPNWFDETDRVPNTMRYYLIAEYIYRHYRPFAVINERSIWVSKEMQFSRDGYQQDEEVTKPKIYTYKKAACYINRYFEQEWQKGGLKEAFTYAGTATPAENRFPGRTSYFIDDGISRAQGVFVRIWLDNPQDEQTVALHLTDGQDGIIGRFTFETSSADKAYMLRLSNHYLWHVRSPYYLQIEAPDSSSVNKVEFYKDNRL